MLAWSRCGPRSIHVTPHWLAAVVFPFSRKRKVKCAPYSNHEWMAQAERLDSEPLASGLTHGVCVSSRACWTDALSGRGPTLVVSGVYS